MCEPCLRRSPTFTMRSSNTVPVKQVLSDRQAAGTFLREHLPSEVTGLLTCDPGHLTQPYFAKGLAEGRVEGLVEDRAKGLVEGRAEGEAIALVRLLLGKALWCPASRSSTARVWRGPGVIQRARDSPW